MLLTQEDRRVLGWMLGKGSELPGGFILDESLKNLKAIKAIEWRGKAYVLTAYGRTLQHEAI